MDSVRPHTGLLEAHRELELLDHVAAAAEASKLQVLVNETPKVLRVSWCTVLRSDAELQRLAGSPGAPETRAVSAPWLPIERAARSTAPPTGCHKPGAIWTSRWSLRQAFQPRISQLAHLGMGGEKLRDGAAIFLVLLDSERQRLDAAQHQEALERRHHAASRLLHQQEPLFVLGPGADQRPAQPV